MQITGSTSYAVVAGSSAQRVVQSLSEIFNLTGFATNYWLQSYGNMCNFPTMSKLEKLLLKLKGRPKNFTYLELQTLLMKLGYDEKKLGKTSGSRVAFVHVEKKHIIRLHKPHPGNELKRYQIDYLKEELSNQGYLR